VDKSRIDHSAAMLAVDRLSHRLDHEENKLRLELMNLMIDHGQPLQETDLCRFPELASFDLERSYPALIDKQMLVSDAGKILFVYPVSALPTRHRVRLADGRGLHAMCAIDAMGAAYTFRQDVSIRSSCSECAEPIELAIRDGDLAALQPADGHILHVDLNRVSDWSENC
jgi:hypothetical protein